MTTAKVLVLVGDQGGCELWRTFMPVTELQRQGYQGVEWGWRDDDRLADIVHVFDAVVLQRLHWPMSEQDNAARWMGAIHKAGIAIIYEVDDDLFSDDFVRRLVTSHDMPIADAEERRECILNTLRACDGVTASTQRVATIARQYTDKPVKVVGNYIDLRWWKRVQKLGQRDAKLTGLTIGWAGGNRPDADVENMAKAWSRLAERYPFITFVVMGHHAKAIYANVPNDRIAMLDWMPINTYPAGLVNIDIGCCPLADTHFNRAKTFIKAMEYAASGAAVVASPTVYNKIIEHGEDGYICDTVDEWEQALSALVEDYTLRHTMSKRLLAKVRRDYTIEQNAWRWLEAWTQIVTDYKYRRRNKILLPNEVMYEQPSKILRVQ